MNRQGLVIDGFFLIRRAFWGRQGEIPHEPG